MRKKPIYGAYLKKTNADYKFEIKYKDSGIRGYAALTEMHRVPKKLVVSSDGREYCLADDGYFWLSFLPDGEYWGLCVIIDANKRVVEWYFDVTRRNYIDADGMPSYDDLYLDIAVFPDGRVLSFDEDELEEALQAREITKEGYDFAYRIFYSLYKKGIASLEFCENLTDELEQLFGFK